nr:bifunctional DNA-formamidopyrimidine glycosylase/DNA-(apurinic or apyrimidinic site) lyase [Ilumatobacteraceae bacterium]
MPELPEVETVRRSLAPGVVGRRVVAVEVGRDRTVRRTSRAAVVDGLVGTTILDARRRGKYLLLPLDSGDEVMVHLRMSGQLLLVPPDAPRAPHTQLVVRFDDDGDELRFVDPRTFGEVVVFDPDHVAVEVPELAWLGVDPIADGLELGRVRAILRSRRRQLKPLLLDQHVIAGIGNIYADEILHVARLRPTRSSETLQHQRGAEARLHAAILEVLTAAIAAGG